MRFLICLLAVLVAACDSPVHPPVEPGTYALRADETVVLRNSSVAITLLADTFRLYSDGSAQRIVRQHLDFVSTADTTLTLVQPYRYTKRGDRIEFEYICPPNALCTAPPHLWGNSTGAGMQLQEAFDPRPRLRYVRM